MPSPLPHPAPATHAESPDRILAAVELATQRAHATATSPMLRAAITTDRATVEDLLRSEPSLALRAGEVLEVYQGSEAPVLLARVPADAAPLTGPGAATLDLRGATPRIEVTVPVVGGTATTAGVLVLATDLDPSALDGVASDRLAEMLAPAIVVAR